MEFINECELAKQQPINYQGCGYAHVRSKRYRYERTQIDGETGHHVRPGTRK